MIIGIFGRPAITSLDNEGILIYKNLCDKIYKYGAFPIGLIPNIESLDFNKEMSKEEFDQMKKLINICDGIILQGGEEMNKFDITLAKYLYDCDIPCLGICLGMQTMAKAVGGVIVSTINHNIKGDYVHDVTINKKSKLYEIIKKDFIFVNSRHNDKVYSTNLDQVAFYEDVIEAVEDKNKKFYIGVQWHPELLDDENSDKLFKAFFDALAKPK